EHAELSLLGGDLSRPAGEAEPTERMVGGTGGDRVRPATRGGNGLQGGLPAVPDADVEASIVETDVAAHDAGQLHVADNAVARVRPVHPLLLHRHRLQAEVAGHAGDLAGVVGLHAAD